MIHIIIGNRSTTLEKTAAEDLKQDLMLVCDEPIEIISGSQNIKNSSQSSMRIFIGCPDTNLYIAQLSKRNLIPVTSSYPGRRGGGVYSIEDHEEESGESVLILAGSDDQGAQYAVYDFLTKDLHIDPFRFWTGYTPAKLNSIEFKSVPSRLIKPPLIPLLVYFDNDNDELANMTKPYLEFSKQHWKELIKSLVRLKYNAIDIHDHLGRAEFYRWPHYRKLVPNYEPDGELIEWLIGYAHERGVMVQVSFYLGWKFKPISDKASLNWYKYKEEWLSTWKYYLEHTPIGKCDIFLNRPRDQRWDRKYRGRGKPAAVFNDAFPEMVKIIKNHNPNAIIIVDLYSEGRKVYETGFHPEPKEDYIMAWPDNGFGKFEYMPGTLDGYKFGIYLHAGFYLNHVVHDPYPFLLEKEIKTAINDYGMTNYCLVNGQTVRHYILNLEVCSRLSDQPQEYGSDEFLDEWTERYFGSGNKEPITRILHLLHKVQLDRFGYISLMGKTTIILRAPRLFSLLRFFPKSLVERVANRVTSLGKPYTARLQQNITMLTEALQICEEIRPNIRDQSHLFHDLIELQITLLLQINQIAYNLNCWTFSPGNKEFLKNAIQLVKLHTETRLEGDKNPQWATWYDPVKRRPNGGYPDIKRLKKLAKINE